MRGFCLKRREIQSNVVGRQENQGWGEEREENRRFSPTLDASIREFGSYSYCIFKCFQVHSDEEKKGRKRKRDDPTEKATCCEVLEEKAWRELDEPEERPLDWAFGFTFAFSPYAKSQDLQEICSSLVEPKEQLVILPLPSRFRGREVCILFDSKTFYPAYLNWQHLTQSLVSRLEGSQEGDLPEWARQGNGGKVKAKVELWDEKYGKDRRGLERMLL